MKQLLIGLAIIGVFVAGLWSASGNQPGVARSSDGMDELTAQAVLTGAELSRQAKTAAANQANATSTADRQLTLNALSDSGTALAIAIKADDATSTAAVATQLTATAVVNGTPTALSITQTAEAEATKASGTATAVTKQQADAATRDAVWGWGCVIVPLAGVLLLAIVGALQLRKIGDATSKRITIEAEANARATEMDAEAAAEEKYAKAEEIRTKTARTNTERIGRTLLRHTADGNPVVMVELLPQSDAADQDRADASPTIPTSDGEMDKYSPAQWRMMLFLEVCIQLNGKKSNVFPTAKSLDGAGVSRTKRGNRLRDLGALVRSRPGKETGGTWVVGYDTLEALYQAVKKGEVALPEYVEDEEDAAKVHRS